MNCHTFTSVAERAARTAGAIILRDFGTRPDVTLKDRINPVTKTDLAAEDAVVSVIAKEFPEHDILAEEREQPTRSSDYLWIIDPLDGTTNFTHAYPLVCVSIALLRRNDIVSGVVYDPLHDELFVAEQGKGATLNGKPLKVSSIRSLEECLLCTGFPYSIRERPADNFRVFEKFSLVSQGVRRDGSAALDLCYLAAGRLDGFWERELRPWDTAAALLILRNAGGRATDYSGNEYNPFCEELVASNALIHDAMLDTIRSAG
jgi:myo-inositol-1(or 4)-monophosphatase